MPSLYITEYSAEGVDAQGRIMPAAVAPSITTQKIAFAGASVQSAALNEQTTLVRLHTDTACHVLFGANPTATTGNMRLAADATEYLSVKANSGLKIAVIQG